MKTRPTRLMTLLLALILLVGGLTACSRGRKKLSKLSDEEIRQYLADAEVEIPDDMEMSTVRKLIADVEKSGSLYGSPYSNPTYSAFCMELGAAVNSYNYTDTTQKKPLYALTGRELDQFLADAGITVPESISREYIRTWIVILEQEPDIDLHDYREEEINDCAEKVKAAFKNYYSDKTE